MGLEMRIGVMESTGHGPQIDQVGLVVVITKYLRTQGFEGVNRRMLNAIIRAADLIVDEFSRPDQTAELGAGLDAWLKSDGVGRSSLFMAKTLLPGRSGQLSAAYAHPHDPSDLHRCLGLLDAVPELQGRIGEMAATGPEWAALVTAWDELVDLLGQEFPGGTAPRTYRRMREILESCRKEP